MVEHATDRAGRNSSPTSVFSKSGNWFCAPRPTSSVVRLITRAWFFSALLLSLASTRAEAVCGDRLIASHSTVSIGRNFEAEEMKAADMLGIRGTAWFLSARSMLTAAHVAEAMNLSRLEWKPVEIRDGDREQSIPVRILRLAGSHSEKITMLELETSVIGAQVLPTRSGPLTRDERVVSRAYPAESSAFRRRPIRVIWGRWSSRRRCLSYTMETTASYWITEPQEPWCSIARVVSSPLSATSY